MSLDEPVAAAVSDYREFPPPRQLAKHVLCMWTQSIANSPKTYFQRVLPDGCIDIILIDDDAPTAVGPWTEPFTAHLAPGTTIVGARFHPGLAPAMLGLPACAMLNQFVPLSSVWRRGVCARFERIAEEPSLPARRSALEAALRERLSYTDPVDEVMRAAIDWLARNPQGRMEQLGRWTGFSTRQLRRRFTAAVGYGPKMFQSVLRFQRLLHFSGRISAPRNLAQVSADLGYADQAHMTREVRRFSGSPPTVLLRSALCALKLSGLIEPACGQDH
jgi:AraC-like DNA-binding protein